VLAKLGSAPRLDVGGCVRGSETRSTAGACKCLNTVRCCIVCCKNRCSFLQCAVWNEHIKFRCDVLCTCLCPISWGINSTHSSLLKKCTFLPTIGKIGWLWVSYHKYKRGDVFSETQCIYGKTDYSGNLQWQYFSCVFYCFYLITLIILFVFIYCVSFSHSSYRFSINLSWVELNMLILTVVKTNIINALHYNVTL